MMERLGLVLMDALLSIPPSDDDERLGPVLVDALLSIPPARFMIYDETLGPVLMDALLPILPVGLMYQVNITGAGIDGCCAPDTASKFI